MKIAIDGYEANVSQRLGSSQVAFELLRNLEKIDQENEYNILLPSPPLGDLPKERVGWRYKILKPKKLWTQIALPLYLYTAKERPGLIFSPTHYIPRFSPAKLKKVATIFDLSFLHFPEMFTKKDLWKLQNWTKFSVQNADHIITISNFSKQDIISTYGVGKDKITVAYPGYDREKFKTQMSNVKTNQIKRKYDTGDDYIIFVGTIQPRKNLTRLVEAFSRVILSDQRRISNELRNSSSRTVWYRTQNDKLQLVIVGKSGGLGREGWMYEEILKTPKKLGIEDRVKFLGFVPTEDLPYLLSGAEAFVLPSLWEGFGIPVLEAMACGIPVIVSNVSSLPEVVGKAGLLIDPYSVDQIEQAIRTIAADKKLRERYFKAGMEQARNFSWEKMARTVSKVFLRYN